MAIKGGAGGKAGNPNDPMDEGVFISKVKVNYHLLPDLRPSVCIQSSDLIHSSFCPLADFV